jgi:hypothetical protein
MCDNVCGSTIFSFLHPRSVIAFQQALMVVFASAFGIRKGLFHGTRIWVHIGDMVAYYHPSLCRFMRILLLVYSGGYAIVLHGDSSKCKVIKVVTGIIFN